MAIAVFLRTKTEHRTLAAHQSETLESHTENNFRISTTEQTFNEPTDVTLKVSDSMFLSLPQGAATIVLITPFHIVSDYIIDSVIRHTIKCGK